MSARVTICVQQVLIFSRPSYEAARSAFSATAERSRRRRRLLVRATPFLCGIFPRSFSSAKNSNWLGKKLEFLDETLGARRGLIVF